MKHTAFVAGATGYTGRAVVAACLARDITTVAHVRPDSPDLRGWETRFGALGADVDTTPWDATAIAQRLRALQPTMVFALLGSTRKRAKREGLAQPYRAVDAGLTTLLLDACAEVAPPPRFVYLSAMGVRDIPNAYIQARWQVEQRLARGLVPYIVARPGLIAGDRDEKRPAESVAYGCAKAAAQVLDAIGLQRFANAVRPLTGSRLAVALVSLALRPPAEPVVQAAGLAALASA